MIEITSALTREYPRNQLFNIAGTDANANNRRRGAPSCAYSGPKSRESASGQKHHRRRGEIQEPHVTKYPAAVTHNLAGICSSLDSERGRHVGGNEEEGGGDYPSLIEVGSGALAHQVTTRRGSNLTHISANKEPT